MRRNILLAFSFASRDFKERYVGTSLGQLWYIISPIITIFIYTVVFSDFMKMKLDIVDSTYSYSIYIVPGLLSWLSFSRTLNILSNSVAQKSNFIKKINVPMFVFYISIIISEFAILVLSIFFGVLFLILIHHPVNFTFIWFLPILTLQMIFVFSLGVIISLFMPFIRDLKEIIPIIIQLWFWMTPIIYLRKMVADKYPLLLTFNPFYHFVHLYQDIFVYSKAPSFNDIMIIFTISMTTFTLSFLLYKKMINAVKDII